MTAAQRKPLKQKAQVKTNTTPGSVCRIDVPTVTFTELWENYVTGQPYKENGEVPEGYENQCAIRLSVTLHKTGIEMKSFTSANVTVKSGSKFGRIFMSGKYTAVLADQMGSWLSKQPFCGLPRKPENVTGPDWQTKIKGRTGIVVFENYWTRGRESAANASGGHIDLWNGSRLTNNGVRGTVTNFLRFTAGWESGPGFSDLSRATKILFWEIR